MITYSKRLKVTDIEPVKSFCWFGLFKKFGLQRSYDCFIATLFKSMLNSQKQRKDSPFAWEVPWTEFRKMESPWSRQERVPMDQWIQHLWWNLCRTQTMTEIWWTNSKYDRIGLHLLQCRPPVCARNKAHWNMLRRVGTFIVGYTRGRQLHCLVTHQSVRENSITQTLLLV